MDIVIFCLVWGGIGALIGVLVGKIIQLKDDKLFELKPPVKHPQKLTTWARRNKNEPIR